MKRFLALLLVPAVILGVSFKDLNPKHWAYEAVVKLAEMGIITGYPDGTFRGKEPVSRYQLAMALYRIVKYIDEKMSTLPAPSSGAGTMDRRLEAKIASLEKLVSDLRRRVAILEKGRGEEGAAGEEISNLESMIKKSFELISKNTSSINDLKSSIEDLDKIQGGLQGELAEMKMRMDELTKDLKNLSNELEGLKKLEDDVNSLKNAIVALRLDVEKYVDEKISELSGKGESLDVDYLKTLVSANVKSIEEIKRELRKLEETVSKMRVPESEISKKDLEKVKERLSKVEEGMKEVENLKGKIEDLEKRTVDIEKTAEALKEFESKFSSIEDDVRGLSSEISRIYSKIDELKKTLNTTTSSQKDFEKRMKELENRVEDLESESASVKDSVEGLKEKAAGIPGWGIFMILLGIVNLAIGGYALYTVLTGGS